MPFLFSCFMKGIQVTENQYQSRLVRKLRRMFPGCEVLKNDPTYIQGFPDLLILFNDKWAILEVKASADAASQPNQTHYVNKLDNMSFASFIYPENEEEVLIALQQAFESPGRTCIPQS